MIGGWAAPSDFLIGLTVIQSFSGANFNLSVSGHRVAATAVLEFLGVFAPGVLLCHKACI